MKIVSALEHDKKLYVVGDIVKVTFDNGRTVTGAIKWYGPCNIYGKGVADSLRIGDYCIELSEVVKVSKLKG